MQMYIFKKLFFLPGIVDIWSNRHGTQPCHSFRGPSRVTQLALSPDHSLFAAAFGDHLSVRQAEGDFEELSHYSYPYQVKNMVPFQYKTVFASMGIPMLKIRWSEDRPYCPDSV